MIEIKGGMNVALSKTWHLTFEGRYTMIDKQFKWNGINDTYSLIDYDTDNDSEPDYFGVPGDYRLVDPGNLRLDAIELEIGLRWVVGEWKFKNGGDDRAAREAKKAERKAKKKESKK